jgi:hypothetical protein
VRRAARSPRSVCAPTTTGANVLATRYAQLLIEALTGQRPVSQLIRYTTDDVYEQLRHLVQGGRLRSRPSGAQPVLRRVHDDSPTAGVLEVTARITVAERSQALAFRLEQHTPQIWRCTALETR